MFKTVYKNNKHQIHQRMLQKSNIATTSRSYIHKKTSKVQSESMRKKSGFQDPPKVWRALINFALGAAWKIWVPMVPAGSQPGIAKSCFGTSCWKDDEKRVFEIETRKTSTLDQTWVLKWRDLGSDKKHFASYLLQSRSPRGVMEYREINGKRGSNNCKRRG